MKYVNAKEVLPTELVKILQDYVNGCYLYIPKGEEEQVKEDQTNYKMELEKRDRHIYERHLEGWGSQAIASIYHLSESSVRRILLKQRQRFERQAVFMEEIIKLWNIEAGEMKQIYHSAWDADGKYVLKAYDNLNGLKRNVQIMKTLRSMDIPTAEIIDLENGEEYVCKGEKYYILTRKLPGSNVTDIRDKKLAFKMGETIGKLHIALQKCEAQLECRDGSLLREINGWVRDGFIKNGWQFVSEEEFMEAADHLEMVYGQLPIQMIHRDVHFGNFLFDNGEFSGYIDFELTQKNIRIFDLCYFLAGLLTEDVGHGLNPKEWLDTVHEVVTGYENYIVLTDTEKEAMPWVMECIELLFVSYFAGIDELRCAEDAARVYRLISGYGQEIKEKIAKK